MQDTWVIVSETPTKKNTQPQFQRGITVSHISSSGCTNTTFSVGGDDFIIYDEESDSDCQDINDTARWLCRALLAIQKMEHDDPNAHCDWTADADAPFGDGKYRFKVSIDKVDAEEQKTADARDNAWMMMAASLKENISEIHRMMESWRKLAAGEVGSIDAEARLDILAKTIKVYLDTIKKGE